MPPELKARKAPEESSPPLGEVATYLLVLSIGFMLALILVARSSPSYAQIRDGQVLVVRYRIAELGKCQAVMFRGRLHAEKCEASR